MEQVTELTSPKVMQLSLNPRNLSIVFHYASRTLWRTRTEIDTGVGGRDDVAVARGRATEGLKTT